MSHRGETTTDCRSDEGTTVGLVDALITILRVLARRDLSPAVVQESLRDLLSDEDLRAVFMAGNLAALKSGLKVDPPYRPPTEDVHRISGFDGG